MNLNERISEIITNFKADPMVLLNSNDDCIMFTENVYEIDDFKKLSLSEFDMESVVLLLIVRLDFSMENLSDFYDLFHKNESDIENGVKIGVSISESTERDSVYIFTKN